MLAYSELFAAASDIDAGDGIAIGVIALVAGGENGTTRWSAGAVAVGLDGGGQAFLRGSVSPRVLLVVGAILALPDMTSVIGAIAVRHVVDGVVSPLS